MRPGEVDPEARRVAADVLHDLREDCPDDRDGSVWCWDAAGDVVAALAAEGYSVGRVWEHARNAEGELLHQGSDGGVHGDCGYCDSFGCEPLYRRVKGVTNG